MNARVTWKRQAQERRSRGSRGVSLSPEVPWLLLAIDKSSAGMRVVWPERGDWSRMCVRMPTDDPDVISCRSIETTL